MNIKFCTQCGKETNNNMKFCGHCGFNLTKATTEPANEVSAASAESTTNQMEPESVSVQSDLVSVEELALFVGKRKYLEKWGVSSGTEVKVQKSWNWSSALFSVYWMAYRKMYFSSIAVFLGTILLSFLLSGLRVLLTFLNVETSGFALYLMNLLVYAVLFIGSGLYGNRLYYRFAKKKILRIKSQNPTLTGQILHNKIQEVGGTNVFMLILFIIVMGLCNWLFSSHG